MPRTKKTKAKQASSEKSSDSPAEVPFEQSLEILEGVVASLEDGELPLDVALEHFEKGMRLSKQCQEQLSQVERRIEVLLGDGANPAKLPLEEVEKQSE